MFMLTRNKQIEYYFFMTEKSCLKTNCLLSLFDFECQTDTKKFLTSLKNFNVKNVYGWFISLFYTRVLSFSFISVYFKRF